MDSTGKVARKPKSDRKRSKKKHRKESRERPSEGTSKARRKRPSSSSAAAAATVADIFDEAGVGGGAPLPSGGSAASGVAGSGAQAGKTPASEGSDESVVAEAEAGGGAGGSPSDAAAEGGKEGGEEAAEASVSFESLGLVPELVTACRERGWTTATPIQREALPVAFEDRDMIGLAETGSGKTGAFALPVLQALLERPSRLAACIIAPTRELAFQIGEQFEALGTSIGLKTAVVVGGVDMVSQAVALAKKPHVVIGTPGRLVDHIENTKGFSLRTIRFLVLDEADKMLSMDFEEELDKILQVLPRERRTFLFSATMTAKVAKLQRASLVDPVKVEVSSKYTTVKTLVQQYLFIPAKHKDVYLAYVLNEFAGQSAIVFVATCNTAQRLALMLRNLGFPAVPLHGQMGQAKRLGSLNKFKSGSRNILIATDVASRGLDIPSVDIVLNYDVPTHGKDYIHRVGRTARAGRSGRAITCVTQYDVEMYQRIEALIGKKLAEFPTQDDAVMVLRERVAEAQRIATLDMRTEGDMRGGRGRKGRQDEDDDDLAARVLRESQMKRRRLQGAIKKNKRARKGD